MTSSKPTPPVSTAGLHHVCDEQPGIRRRRCGRGFAYVGADGRPVRDAATLQRIRGLAIPPAWRDVWICADAAGHLQATGRDARGRKQYRYHVDWRERCEQDKFSRVAAFGRRLPRLRRLLRAHLALPGLPRQKVLALVISVMAVTLIRVGNREYARSNHSYGLTTLRSRHARIERGRVRFLFRGKSGRQCEAGIDDPQLVRLIRRCRELPGHALFQFVDDDGSAHPVDSGMVNDYLRDGMGGDFTAKDFRTWGGTLAAALAFADTPLPRRRVERVLAAKQNDVIRAVAGVLGNTPAVCRRSYIHPAICDLWRDGRLHALAQRARFDTGRDCERFVLRALRSAARKGEAGSAVVDSGRRRVPESPMRRRSIPASMRSAQARRPHELFRKDPVETRYR
jgi:DNA topoisomerase I